MSFFQRYRDLCVQKGYEPCSQKIADLLGVTKTTISVWGKNDKIPGGKTVAVIADVLHVSTDYLLERTDDSTDYANVSIPQGLMDIFDENKKRALAFQHAVESLAPQKQQEAPAPQFTPEAARMYNALDEIDRAQVNGIMQGLLSGEKYKKKRHA